MIGRIIDNHRWLIYDWSLIVKCIQSGYNQWKECTIEDLGMIVTDFAGLYWIVQRLGCRQSASNRFQSCQSCLNRKFATTVNEPDWSTIVWLYPIESCPISLIECHSIKTQSWPNRQSAFNQGWLVSDFSFIYNHDTIGVNQLRLKPIRQGLGSGVLAGGLDSSKIKLG